MNMTGSDSSVVFSQPVTGFASIAFGYPNALWGEPQSPGSRERREVKCFLQEWLLGQWQVQPLALD